MRDGSLAVTTTKEPVDSSFQLADYIDELGATSTIDEGW
jgi:hypothetical protein